MSKSPDFQVLHDVAVVRGANFGAFALGIPIATTLYVQRQNRLLIRNIHPTWRMFLGGGALWGGGYLGIRCFLEAWEILGDTNQINAYLDGRQPSEYDVSRLQNYYGPRWK